MNYINDTPYRRYQEIREAVMKSEVCFSYNRATGYRIACQVRKSYAMTFLYIPALTAVVIYILCLYLPIPKAAMFFALLGIVLYPFVPYVRRLLLGAGVVLIVLSAALMRENMWPLALGAALIVVRLTYDVWWLFISRVANRTLLNDEAVFEAEWKQKNVALERHSDGSYFMFGKSKADKQKNKEKKDKSKDETGTAE